MKTPRIPFLRAAVIVTLTMLVAGGAIGQDNGQDEENGLDWPRKITGEKGEIVIYQPQVESFVGDKLE